MISIQIIDVWLSIFVIDVWLSMFTYRCLVDMQLKYACFYLVLL